MREKSSKNGSKILVILGPTATGKSELAARLARKYNGEVISADSRQVYKGLDIGTGKITKKEMRGVPHYMLDVVSPKKVFTVAEWQKQTKKIITDIISRGKLPIICGGTGFYIQSIVEGLVLPEVPPNKPLRKKLENKSLEELQKLLAKLAPRRFASIDIKNPVRLIRAIEITEKIGSVPTLRRAQGKNSYEFLQIGLKLSEKDLKIKIHDRVLSRMKRGMIKETKNLHKNGLSWKRMRELGLEYKYLAYYLEKKTTKQELCENIEKGNLDYAKRQMVWFKRPARHASPASNASHSDAGWQGDAGGDKKIKWFKPTEHKAIEKAVARFINS